VVRRVASFESVTATAVFVLQSQKVAGSEAAMCENAVVLRREKISRGVNVEDGNNEGEKSVGAARNGSIRRSAGKVKTFDMLGGRRS